MTRKLTLFIVCAFEIALILLVAAWTAWADVGYCYLDDKKWKTNCVDGDTLGFISDQFGVTEEVIHRYCNFDYQIVLSKYSPAKEVEISSVSCVFQTKMRRN